MKRKLVILFGVIIILLTIIFATNKQTAKNQDVLGEKLNQENIKTLKQENKEEKKSSTTKDNLEDGNIQYLPAGRQGSILNISQDNNKSLEVVNNFNDKENSIDTKQYYLVTKVVDGDTIDVYPVKSNEVGAEQFNGILTGTTTERVRLIGINTPETVDPRKPVECFGREASAKAHELLENKKIYLAADETQDNRDKYKRLLRYAFREDGLFYNLEIIKLGYAYEYTYQIPYQYQTEFKAAQVYAKENKLGLWADNACAVKNNMSISVSTATVSSSGSNCNIKGNINSKGEKIYHLPACEYYAKTVINLNQGEKYFCSESEAQAAGWRKAQNCK